MKKSDRKIRIALPSKGLLTDGSRQLLADVGLAVYNPNPRQYIASIPQLPEVEVIFQRPGDIVIGVKAGSVDFGITGRDIFLEKRGNNGKILELHSKLGFARCSLNVIIPDNWEQVDSFESLVAYQEKIGRPLKIATKFPNLTKNFFQSKASIPFEIIPAEGALEIAPTVGYADLIVDLVSTGTTLRDNRLKKIPDGKIMDAEACLLANRERLKTDSKVLEIATRLLEMIGAYLRGRENLAVFANIRANSMDEIKEKIFKKKVIAGLQGPTISKILTRDDSSFFAIHIVVRRNDIHQAVGEIRDMGGSGVVVSPVSFIFEEEPSEVVAMKGALEI